MLWKRGEGGGEKTGKEGRDVQMCRRMHDESMAAPEKAAGSEGGGVV